MPIPLPATPVKPAADDRRRAGTAAVLSLVAACLVPLCAPAGGVSPGDLYATPPKYVDIDLAAQGIDDASLDDENKGHRNWALGLGGTHNFGWGLGWAPGPWGIGGGLIAYEANLGLKAVPPVLEAPPRQAWDPNVDGCFYDLSVTHDAVETFEDYLGFGPPFRPGQPGLEADWGELGTPTVFHFNTSVAVETFLNGRLLGRQDGAGSQTRRLGVGRHILEWRATNLVTPITDLVPWFLFNAFSIADAAKKTGNTKILLDLAQNAALTFGPLAGATIAGLEGERTEWHKVRRQDLWVLDTVNPELEILQPRYAVEALDVGGRVFNDALEREIREKALAWSDKCGREVEILVEAPDFLPVGRDIPIVWRALDPGPDKDRPAASDPDDPARRRPDDLRNETRKNMTLEVRDTLPPILEPPRGRVVESAKAQARVLLGRPGVFDIADPKAKVFARVDGERVKRRITVPQNSRTKVVWTARDNSGNTSKKTQWLTVKAPGTNTRPRALDATVDAISFEPTEITLRGQDDDLIDGRYDQLAFRITRPPRHGNFIAPLFPYFIEDFRVAATLPEGLPNGYYDESDTDGDGLLSKPELDALFDRWCDETPDEPMPRSFVTNPRYMSINDRGEMYVSDEYNVCFGPDSSAFHRTYPRLARFDKRGEILAEVKLNDNQEVDSLFIDHEGFAYYVTASVSRSAQRVSRIDPEPDTFNSNPGEPPLMDQDVFAIDIPPNDQGLFDPWGKLQSVVVDRNGLMYVTDGNSVYAFLPDSPREGQARFLGAVVAPNDFGGDRSPSDYMDMTVDSEGNLYFSDEIQHRVWKYGPSVYEPETDTFVAGRLIGWLGRCAGNLTEKLACDTENQRSFGFRCTDETCRVETAPRDLEAEHAACGIPVPEFVPRGDRSARAGCEPGQLFQPKGLAMGPRDTLYVADFSNFRIQRFTAAGSFGGEARSECDGTCFVLGDFGRPRDVTVNRDNFYVLDVDNDWLHIFETTPVTNVDDESQRVTQRAYVTYQSDNNFRGRDSFRFKTSDGLEASAPATVTVDVRRNHRPPETIEGQPIRTLEDRAVEFQLAAVDPDEDELRFRIVSAPRNGTLTGTDRDWRYTPNPDFEGFDSFVYVADDGLTSSPATQSPETRVYIQVLPVPDPPVFRELELVDLTGRGYTNTLRADIYDPDLGDRLRAVIDWGDGTVQAAAPPPTDEGQPMLVQGGSSSRVTASHYYRNGGTYTVRVCASDRDSTAPLTSCTSSDVTALTATVVDVRDMADVQIAVTEDLPKFVEPDCPPDVDEDGNCPVRSGPMIDGTPVTYTVDVYNPELNGFRPTATGVEVEVDIPRRLVVERVSAASPAGSATPEIRDGQVRVRFNSLAADDVGTITLEGRTDGSYASDGRLKLDVRAKAAQPDPTDKNLVQYETRVESDPAGDADGDGVANRDDAFPGDPRESADHDGDGIGDNGDLDDDNDLMPDAWEERYGLDARDRRDRSGDLDGDGLDNRDEFLAGTDPTMADTDLDLVTDAADNCPALFNHDQGDLDGDGTGNLCDPDFAAHSAKIVDQNGNGRPEIAVMSRAANGSWPVQVFDTQTGERLARFPAFGPQWSARALVVLNNGGKRELVAMGVRDNGTARVAIFDPATGRERTSFEVLARGWAAIDLAAVPRLIAGGEAAVAVLGRKRDGTTVAEVRRAEDGELVRRTRFFGPGWTPRRMLAIGDVDDDGGHELAVLAEHPDGRIASVIKTARGGFGLRTDRYFGEAWRFRDFADLGDVNGRGADELAVLAQRRDGRHAVLVRDARSGRELAEVRFPGDGWSASRVRATADLDDSGAMELAVLMQRDDGRIRVETKDALTGSRVGRAGYLTGAWSPQGLWGFPDAAGAGVPALGVVATRGADGRTKLEARDAVTGGEVASFVVP
jgi:hypothetical protein